MQIRVSYVAPQFNEHSLECLHDECWRVTAYILKISGITNFHASSLILITPVGSSIGIISPPAFPALSKGSHFKRISA